MYSDLIDKSVAAAEAKVRLLDQGIGRYLLASALAGLYVGLGILLIFTVAGELAPANIPGVKIFMGVFFGIALSLVIMAGSELFTGNNMIMAIAVQEGRSRWGDLGRIWGASYFGNLLGALALAWLFVRTGLASGGTGDFIAKASAAKMAAPLWELFVRGILCNLLVCLAVLCSLRLKEETAKLIMIFWCLFAFITCGYEHSIANMTLLSVGILQPGADPEKVNALGMVRNLVPVTLGNIVGGVFLGLAYRYISRPPAAPAAPSR